METTTETPVIQKTRELCQLLLTQPEFASIRRRVDTFLNTPKAQQQFQELNDKGEFLHHKQHQGIQLSDAEVADFEKDRNAAMADPVIRGFLEAQREMHKIEESISQYVLKTFELGRVPETEDFEHEHGGCGHGGCGCQH